MNMCLNALVTLLYCILFAIIPAYAHASFGSEYKPQREGCAKITKTNVSDVFMQARQLQYDDANKTYRAVGNVEIYYNNRRLKADYVDYNPLTGDANAKGNVHLYDFSTDVTVEADTIALNKDFSVAVAKGVKALRGHYIKASALSINRKNKNITIFKNISYTPCTFVPHKGEPIWSVSAEKIIDNEATQDVVYQNASFNILGTPIVTVPEFTYPRPGVKRRSGFLSPEFQIDTNNGASASAPYFYALSPSQDLTFQPVFYSKSNPLLRNKYRQKTDFGYFETDNAFTFTDTKDSNNVQTDNNRFRGSILSKGRFRNESNQNFGFDLNRVTDDTFLRRFNLGYPTFLQSRLFYNKEDRYTNLYVSSYAFQVTDGTTDDNTVPLVLPFIEYHKQLEKQFLGGDVYFKSNVLGLHRVEGLDTRRAVTATQWTKNIDLPFGIVLGLDNELRGDIYHTSNGLDPSDNTHTISQGFTERLLPRSSAKFSLPFVKRTSESIQVLEPAVQTVISPYGGNPNNIPNEDGFATEFDATGLFDSQRFYGYDLVESGPRLNTGLRYLYHIPHEGGFETQFGQSYRVKPDSRFASYTGLQGKSSDYVGRFVVNYQDYVHLTHRYRLKNENLGLSLSDLTLDTGTDRVRLSVSHFSIDDYDAGTIFNNSEQLTTGLRVSLDKNWHLLSGYRENIQTKQTLETRGGIMYTDECLVASIAVGRQYLLLNDIQPTTSVQFRLRLLATGNDNY